MSRSPSEYLDEPPSWRDVIGDLTRENRFYIYLATFMPILFVWTVAGLLIVHIHVTEVSIMSTVEAQRGIDFANEGSLWGLYLNFTGVSILMTLAIEGLYRTKEDFR